MSTQHLLTCPHCDHEFPVDTTQAGQPTPCPSCQQNVDVPTLRKIRDLPVVEQTQTTNTTTLGHRERTQFALGLGLAIIGIGMAAVFFYLRSQLQTEIPPMTGREELVETIQQAPIDALWEQWNSTIRSSELAEWTPSPLAQERKTARLFFGVAVTGAIIGLVGLLTAAIALLRKPKPVSST